MAVQMKRVSDLSGEPDAEAVTIGYGTRWYELDVIDSERQDLESVLRPYLDAGRETYVSTMNRFVPDTTPDEREQIRAWAKKKGYELAAFGKIPNKIYRDYQTAHPRDEV